MEIDDNFTYLNIDLLENLTKEDRKYTVLAKNIADDIKLNKILIVDLIKKLGGLLLSQYFSKRELGVLILSETLKNIESNALNPEQITVLASYFAEKLKDHHQVASSALKGVLRLVNFPTISNESVVHLLTSIFNHITCQQQQQEDRYLIFQIFESVLTKHTDVVTSMGIDFVYGIISSIDGERDPKNLIYLFDWLQVFLKTVSLGHLTEEVFEVLACYFPVDFKAPSDKNVITREDLANGLCKCLTCISAFGENGIALALEKLDSALKIAKEDSLDILKSGCANYDTEIYNKNSIELWSQIQKEIFNTTDIALRLKCLETLREIISKLSEGDQKSFENTVLDITSTLKGNILPDSKIFTPSWLILVYVARASEASSIIVAKQVVPLLENAFKITTNSKQKAVILHTIIEFVKAVIETNVGIQLNSIEEISNCSFLCYQAIISQDSDLNVEGYKGFSEILGFISESLRKTCLENLQKILVERLESNVKEAMLATFKRAAELFPEEVTKEVLTTNTLYDINALDNYLEAINYLVTLRYFETYVIHTYINHITLGVQSCTVSLKHLNVILNKFDHIDNLLDNENFVTKLLCFLEQLENADNYLLKCIYEILQNIVRNRNCENQKNMYVKNSNINFKNRDVYVVVLSGLIVPLHQGVFDDYEKIDFLLECYQNTNEEFVKEVSIETIANILNKLDNEAVLNEKLNKIKLFCDNCSQEAKIWIISWIIKSLVTRNHSNTWQWTDMLLNCLDSNMDAAKGFRIVMDESYKVISEENHYQIMPLYQQKFLIYCANKLNESYHEESNGCLNAIGYLIENAPKEAVVGHFKKSLRLILASLERCREPKVLEILLQRISDFVVDGESVVEDNLEDVLLRVLELTKFEGAMTVRLAAIKCIQKITEKYKVYQLLPHKQKVIQQLGICVDDKKRLIRREAMECRSLWYLLDAPV